MGRAVFGNPWIFDWKKPLQNVQLDYLYLCM